MQSYDWEVVFLAVLVSAACAIPGVYLVLRRVALMSDAISHAILLGIVLAFFATHDLSSPLLLVGASGVGVLTVFLVELLHRTGRVREDAAIALVFPSLFSAGVLLIGLYAGDAHLDVDAVLLGELVFAPLDRLQAFGYDIGPKSMWTIGTIFVINVCFVIAMYKELEVSTFDAGLASALGFMPGLLGYGLMTTVSITAVGAFEAVGSILVVALMIVPACSAYLLTDRLRTMLILAPILAVIGSLLGYPLARFFDLSLAGAMASMQGMLFLVVFLLAPDRGLVATVRRMRGNRIKFAVDMLLIHLLHHEGTVREQHECRLLHLDEHLGWTLEYAARIADRASSRGNITQENGRLFLTETGRARAQRAFVEVPG